jgi:hypothetical protein
MSHPPSPFDLTSEDPSLLAFEGARWMGTSFPRDGKFLAGGCLVACGPVLGRTRSSSKVRWLSAVRVSPAVAAHETGTVQEQCASSNPNSYVRIFMVSHFILD